MEKTVETSSLIGTARLCECGCGKLTPLATRARAGYLKGQPVRFLRGHIGALNSRKIYQSKILVGADGLQRKRCTRCKKPRLLDEFNKSSYRPERRRAHCKLCEREQANNFYRKNPEPYRRRARIFKKVSGARRLAEAERIKREVGCLICGERLTCVLDFHHRFGNSKGKDGGVPVSRAAYNSDRQFKRELAKCVVVCANCHRKIHAGVAILPEVVIDLSSLVRFNS